MSTQTSETRTEAYVDHGPVWEAVSILLDRSTLAHHLRAEDGGRVVRVYHDPDDVPYAVWGSGTQALWRLLCAIAHSAETVSLYEVVSHLDASNRRAAAAAIGALCA